MKCDKETGSIFRMKALLLPILFIYIYIKEKQGWCSYLEMRLCGA